MNNMIPLISDSSAFKAAISARVSILDRISPCNVPSKDNNINGKMKISFVHGENHGVRVLSSCSTPSFGSSNRFVKVKEYAVASKLNFF